MYVTDMGDNLASPLHQSTDGTKTHLAILKHEDPTQAFSSLRMDSYKIEKWTDIWMINFNA